jgi:hypothetical protein
MRLLIGFVFFTFVLLGVPAWSASPKSIKPGVTKEELNGENLAEGRDQHSDPSRLEPTNPADMPGEVGPIQKPPRSTWGPVDLNVHFGFMQGDLVETDGDEDNTYNVAYLGVRFIPHERQMQSADYTLEIDSKNLIHVQVGYRWNLEDGAFHKGYYRVGVADFIKSSQGPATHENHGRFRRVGFIQMEPPDRRGNRRRLRNVRRGLLFTSWIQFQFLTAKTEGDR